MTLADAFTAYCCALSMRVLRRCVCRHTKPAANDNHAGLVA